MNQLPESFILRHGSHKSFEQGACLLEAVSFLAGEPHSNRPQCACAVLSAFGRRMNDVISDDETRTRLLLGFAPQLVGTKSTPDVEHRRVWIAADWAIREVLPLWLDLSPELAEHSAALRALPEIADKASAERAHKVRDAARAAAWTLRCAKREALSARLGTAAADAAYAYASDAYAYASDASDAYAYAADAADAASDAADAADAAADAAYAADAAADAAYAAYAYASDAAADASLRSAVEEKMRAAKIATWESGALCLKRMLMVGRAE